MTNIVLAPGILGFARIGPVPYFNGVAEHLERTFPGLRARAMTTHPLGTVAARADFLAEQIVVAFGASEPVHIIAHSMGGLDARLLVARDLRGVGARVKTVVGLGTPHLGSPIAGLLDVSGPTDALLRHLGLDQPFVEELRAHTGAVHDLAPATAAAFDRACPDRPHVRYLDIVGVGREGTRPTSTFFAPAHAVVLALAGPNDGVVPVTSAARGRTPFAAWPADHADLIGHDLDAPMSSSNSRFRRLQAYEHVVRAGIL